MTLKDFERVSNELIRVKEENQELKETISSILNNNGFKFKNNNGEIVFELNDNVKCLEKENQELKKQLEDLRNGYKNKLNEMLSEGIEPDPEDFYLAEIEGKSNDYDKLLNQQKEFIKYLRDEIYSIEPKGTGINYNCEYDSEEDYVRAMQEQSRLNTLKEILQKIQRNNRR